MQETVTVDEAITRGHRMVNYPSMVIAFATIGVCMYAGIQKLMPFWIVPAGFILGFVLAWLYWGIMITKWRLWAFDNVRNVHELKKRAIREKLIWKDDSIFEKTEIRTSSDKQQWESLQRKFDKEDVFYDDLTVANETIIYYSKGKNYMEMAIMLGCLGVGIYMVTKTDSQVPGILLSLAGAFFGYKEYKEATNTEPQIVLNDRGIQTASTAFYEWKDIENDEAISERSGKHAHGYLVYDHPDGAERLQIDDLDTDLKALNALLILYRGRSKRNSR